MRFSCLSVSGGTLISPCLGRNVCTIFVGSTTFYREGDMTKSTSVGIWISASNNTSSLPVSIEVSGWAFCTFLPVYFPIVP